MVFIVVGPTLVHGLVNLRIRNLGLAKIAVVMIPVGPRLRPLFKRPRQRGIELGRVAKI